MPNSTYFKPDVEVLQEFRNVNPLILRATLQSVVVGPAFHNVSQQKLGAYAASEIELPISNLSPGAVILEDSISVSVKNYAGVHQIEKTVLRVQSNSGAMTASNLHFVDLNQNFIDLGVVASTGPGNNDGDFVHVIVGPKAGYFEVLQVIDANTLLLDDPDGIIAAGNATDLDYTIGNFGWLLVDIDETTKGVRMSPRLTDSGIVYIDYVARRKDYTDRILIAESVTELETLSKETISAKNPLFFGMTKTLASLGANEVVLGLMVEDDSTLSYQKAFEYLEAEEVYCIVPLTTNPIVHQLLMEHVNAMSEVTQKKERIGLFNTARHNRVIKQGYFGRQDPITKIWDNADGDITFSGLPLNDAASYVHEALIADGSGVAQTEVIPAGYDRLVVYFRPGVDYALSYALQSAPLVDVPMTINDDGMVYVSAPSGDSFANVKFTSTASHVENCHIFYARTDNMPANVEMFYPTLVQGGTQMDQPYFYPTAGHRALKVRHYNVDAPTADPLVGVLPGGMTLRVAYGNGSVRDINALGSHSFGGDIESIYVFNAAGVTDADKHLIEVMVLQNAGTYKVDTLIDNDATFLSANIVPGEDELVIIDKTVVDDTTFSKYKETRYKVSQMLSETELKVSQVYNPATKQFELGEFPGVADAQYYRVETPVITNKYELAAWYRDISKGFASRRMTHIYAPAVGITDDGVTITPVPGYFFACAYAGATQADLPQNGFTNRPFAGFARVFFTNDYFTEAQLNVIAEGGTTIVIQPRALAPLTVRHQLTTDMTFIETREYSVTKNVDHMAKTARISFRPYIGRYLINDTTLSILYQLGSALVTRWKENGQLIAGDVSSFTVDPTQVDRVVACFNMKVPIPLNFIRLTFVI